MEESALKRAYEIWERASTLVAHAKNDFDLSDVVLTLKRSVNQRLKTIESSYHLKGKVFDGKPKHYLDLLACLGIIRPLLFHKLLKIRNAIEHEDTKPPSRKQCFELVDIVWYFLKSTDSLVAVQRSGWEVDTMNDKYGYNLEINWGNGSIEISGWFPASLISETPREGFIKCVAKKRETKSDFANDEEKRKYHKNKSTTDTWLIGELCPDSVELLTLYRKLFGLYS